MREIVNECVCCEVCHGCGRDKDYEGIWCDECGEQLDECDVIKGEDGEDFCSRCYKEYRLSREDLTADKLLNYPREPKEIRLNAFLLEWFSEADIEALLMDKLRAEAEEDKEALYETALDYLYDDIDETWKGV